MREELSNLYPGSVLNFSYLQRQRYYTVALRMNLDPVFVKLTAAKETLREVWVRSYRHSYLLN